MQPNDPTHRAGLTTPGDLRPTEISDQTDPLVRPRRTLQPGFTEELAGYVEGCAAGANGDEALAAVARRSLSLEYEVEDLKTSLKRKDKELEYLRERVNQLQPKPAPVQHSHLTLGGSYDLGAVVASLTLPAVKVNLGQPYDGSGFIVRTAPDSFLAPSPDSMIIRNR